MPAKQSKGSRKIGNVMHEFKEGTLKSGASGEPVKDRGQAVAIALSEAREAGAQLRRKPPAKASKP